VPPALLSSSPNAADQSIDLIAAHPLHFHLDRIFNLAKTGITILNLAKDPRDRNGDRNNVETASYGDSNAPSKDLCPLFSR
jgi:hypothetical protein